VTYTEGGRGSDVGYRSGQRMGKMRRRLTNGQETGGMDKMHGEGPFYSCVGEGWMGWMGHLALVASARPCPVSSACTRGRRSERLL
jgi:hypothetical protein